MANDLLLRLFTSEHFNAWIAISYIFRYPDNVGIQHYLCAQLRKFPIAEIEFFLPQLMHLLITRPTESVALECYVIDACEQSTHIAVMSLWYLQAYLSDLSTTPNSPSFQLCKRVLNKCQGIVFSSHVDSDDEQEDKPRVDTSQRVRENVFPAFVGMGALLAGISQPLVTKPVGSVAIAQGRKPSPFSSLNSTDASIVSRRNSTLDETQQEQCLSADGQLESRFQSACSPQLPPPQQQKKKKPTLSNSFKIASTGNFLQLSLEDLHRGKAFSVSRYLKEARHKINSTLTSHDMNTPPQLLIGSREINQESLNAMAQSSVPVATNNPSIPNTPITDTTPIGPSRAVSSPCLFAYSSEGVLGQSPPKRSPSDDFKSLYSPTKGDLQDPEALLDQHNEEDLVYNSSESDDDEVYALAKLSLDDRRHLLRSNYFRSEMQFILALVDIATRLVIVPKPARLSALHAELTLLNHNLPAEICMPLWCPATVDRPYHHRIVRISPTDAVVLNSAERAPYLLMIEVLDDELSLENGFKSSLSRIKKYGHRHSYGNRKRHSMNPIKTKMLEDDAVDLGDLGSPKSERSLDIVRSTSNSTINTVDTMHNSHYKDIIKEEQCISINEGILSASPHSSSDIEDNPEESYTESTFDAEGFAEKMKTAAILLAQLQLENRPQAENVTLRASTEGIRQKIITEMMALEDDRMERMAIEGVHKGVGGGGGEGAGNEKRLDDESRVAMVVNREDPSAAVFSENWEDKKERIRNASPYGHLPNWRLISVIVKNGADLRQEQFAIQLIREMQKIWDDNKVKVWVQYIRILVTSDDSGLIETVKNSISIHSIKKEAYIRKWNEEGSVYSLRDYFTRRWGSPETKRYKKAQDAFMRSLAGYSIACYLMQIKDRHNGNLLIDDQGHIIHIDFGFILSNSPGSVGFEMAPFKLPQEYIDILGGVNGEKFAEYKALTKAAFLALRKHCDNILLLTEMMCKDSRLPCFANGQHALTQLRDRFQLHLTEPQVEAYVDKLIVSSCCNVFTRLYDTYQYYSQGIL